jgi:hypothetical protein
MRLLRKMMWEAASSCDVDFHFCRAFLHEFCFRSVANMSYRLCGRSEAQNGRSDSYEDGTGGKLSVIVTGVRSGILGFATNLAFPSVL